MSVELSAWWEDMLMFCAVCERRQVHVVPPPTGGGAEHGVVTEEEERLCVECGAAVWLGHGPAGQVELGRSA